MYPSAYYTYNPSRMKKAERAYFKHGKNAFKKMIQKLRKMMSLMSRAQMNILDLLKENH